MLYTENSFRTKAFSLNIPCHFKEIKGQLFCLLKNLDNMLSKKQTDRTNRQTDRQTGQTDRQDTCFALKEYFTLA